MKVTVSKNGYIDLYHLFTKEQANKVFTYSLDRGYGTDGMPNGTLRLHLYDSTGTPIKLKLRKRGKAKKV